MTQDYEYIPLDDEYNYFYSTDLGLCAYLICEGFELSALDRTVPSKVMFIIKREDKRSIDAFQKAFWNSNGADIDAQTYFNMLKRLKNQIHSSSNL